ncbi:hypothetical protein FEF34_26995 [Streptomyces marianii]|uniref:Transposase DDE domain-containing protein n=1 Tax=Streptomyces marianii TaxID=1817406 RepID=A0A5R9EDN2_9ACTN|nr:hypothetical protein FEF34_26995 [Streptomyces marianii]
MREYPACERSSAAGDRFAAAPTAGWFGRRPASARAGPASQPGAVLEDRLRPCQVKDSCTRGPRRKLTLQDRDIHEVLHQRRAEQDTDEWKERYKLRAGVEGAISQAVNRCGLRRSRYRGLAETSLQHQRWRPAGWCSRSRCRNPQAKDDGSVGPGLQLVSAGRLVGCRLCGDHQRPRNRTRNA